MTDDLWSIRKHKFAEQIRSWKSKRRLVEEEYHCAGEVVVGTTPGFSAEERSILCSALSTMRQAFWDDSFRRIAGETGKAGSAIRAAFCDSTREFMRTYAGNQVVGPEGVIYLFAGSAPSNRKIIRTVERFEQEVGPLWDRGRIKAVA